MHNVKEAAIKALLEKDEEILKLKYEIQSGMNFEEERDKFISEIEKC